jgi:hypothetical protein
VKTFLNTRLVASRQLCRIAAVMGFVLLAGASMATAQLAGTVKFSTTFPFTVGNRVLPAGSYTVTSDDDAPYAFAVIEGSGVRVFWDIRPAEASRDAAKTEVVFTQLGKDHILKSVWVEGSTDGIETAAAEPERQAASGTAQRAG